MERIFQEFDSKTPKETYKPITKIINNQLDIKFGQFSLNEFDIVQTKIKNRKAVGLDKIPPELWKSKEIRRRTALIVQRRI